MSFARTIFHNMTLSELSDANYRLSVYGYGSDELCIINWRAVCNQLARAIIRRMRSEHNGTCWLVNTMNGTLTPYTHGMVYNFACDFVLPRYDAAVADALADIKEHGLSAERLERLHSAVDNVNGECIFWK